MPYKSKELKNTHQREYYKKNRERCLEQKRGYYKLQEVEKILGKLGIMFDTGLGTVCCDDLKKEVIYCRDWELDWSLKGAKFNDHYGKYQLRQEAIKWSKEFGTWKGDKYRREPILFNASERLGAIRAFKHFFNIKEEDLK